MPNGVCELFRCLNFFQKGYVMISRRVFMAGASAAYLCAGKKIFAKTGRMAGSFDEGSEERGSSIRIGNFYYRAPNGIAFIWKDAAAFVINPGGSHNAGTVGPADSFHKVIFAPETTKPKLPRVESNGRGLEMRLLGVWSRRTRAR